MTLTGRADCSLQILSPKKERKLEAREEADDSVGKEGRDDRESRLLRVFQSLRG